MAFRGGAVRLRPARVGLLTLCLALPLLLPFTARSEPLTDPDFAGTWTREDQPVAAGLVARTWLWGPEPFTGAIEEPCGTSPGGVRTVQYFDKARMEINDPGATRDRWFVTTGLLASELMTGAMQTSDEAYAQRGPALIPVAGDLDDPDGPTYASFDRVRNAEPFPTGTTLVTAIDRSGTISHQQRLAGYNVLAERYVPETRHTIASVFWDFLNTTGPVVEGEQAVNGRLFEPWFYATGLPITEAYWSSARVGGEQKDVLVQVFERRVLTYTPSNEPAWRVELGNVGLHYYWWRYLRDGEVPADSGQILWRPDLTRISADRPGSDGWHVQFDPERAEAQISRQQGDDAAGHHLIGQVWHGGLPHQEQGYRISVDVELAGDGEAGLGIQLAMDDGGVTSMVYFGVDNAGVRYVAREYFDGRGTEFLLRPASGVPGWTPIAGDEFELAVTVHAGRVWFHINGEVAGEIEIHDGAVVPGVALVAGYGEGAGDAFVVTFQNLEVSALVLP